MGFQKGIDRNQNMLFPINLEDMIPKEHPVRIIDLFIHTLDLTKLGFLISVPADEGRPGYDPKDLLKLYLYGYLNRIRTSRLLERECERNVEVMWLLKGLKPCFRTIAGFRSMNSAGLKNLFRHFVLLMKKWNLVAGETIAIDSSKFRAVNSKKNNFNPRKIERQLNYIDNKIEEYLIELTLADEQERSSKEINQDILIQLSRQKKYLEIKRKLEESGEDQISTTDPDSRSMILHGSVIEVAYNVQTAVDDKNKLIVHFDVTNDNDRKALHGMANETKQILGKDKITVLADKGYHNAEQLHACKEDEIITYVAVPEIPRKNEIPTENYYGDKFIYDEIRDQYICPQEQVLTTNGNWYQKKYKRYITEIKQYKTEACATCPARTQCTSNPRGRILERSQYASAMEENGERIKYDLKKYLLRQQIVEHPFGTIKRQWSMDHILLKGIKKNNGEFGLIYFAYNFRRVMNILGCKELTKRLKKLFLLLYLLWERKGVNRAELFFQPYYRLPVLLV
jgi:transposase